MNRRLIFCLLLGVLPLAGAPQAPEAEEIHKLDFSLLVFRGISLMTNATDRSEIDKRTLKLWYHDGSRFLEVTARTGRVSNQLHYEGPLPLYFYGEKPASLEELPKPIAKLDASVLPPDAVLILLPVGKGYRVVTADRSVETFPASSGLIYNMGNQRLAYKLGESKGYIDPLKSVAFPFGSRHYTDLMMLSEQEGKWQPVYSGRLMTPSDNRIILLAYRPRSDKQSWTVQQHQLPSNLN